MNEQSTLGVGVTLKDAETTRIRLIKSNILLHGKKPIKRGNTVYFPITNTKIIPTSLKGIPFKLKNCVFPNRSDKVQIHDYLQKEFPHVNWENISLKYDQLGKVAVLKLDPTLTSLSIRQRVGELIISQSPRLKTVLNKSDIVKGDTRVYPTEHLAGEKIWKTWHQEYGLFIYVDLKRAYFNPRLAEEHHRVAMSITQGENILDLFTGVGPFALHCTKELDCNVVAIDINPFAIHALKKSIERNKLKGNIFPIIGDAQSVLRIYNYFDRIIINLPQKSGDFLPYATNLLKRGGIITFYQFVPKLEDPETQVRDLISTKLASVNSYKELYFKVGREVSPSQVQVNCDLQIL